MCTQLYEFDTINVALMKKADFYNKLEGLKIQCQLCPHECIIRDGKIGICKGKKNISGELYAENYGKTTSLAFDPIEKKPLFHFYPGSDILSIGPNGCNLNCSFCQNWRVSQDLSPTKYLPPDEAVEIALKSGAIGLAYTYSEPFIWFEYVHDTASIAHKKGLKNVLVTNGFVKERPLKSILPFIDAMNVDIKSMDDSFYKKECGGSVDHALKTVEISARECHVEVTNLLIPDLNDSDELIIKLSEWLASVNRDIPLHFSRYYPQYKLLNPSTPESTLRRAFQMTSKVLNYVYVGNVTMEDWSNTRCHNCGNTIIERQDFSVIKKHYSNGQCNYCCKKVPIIG